MGVLKDYSPEFIEILDVPYRIKENDELRKADVLVARQHGLVRHLAEEPRKTIRRLKFLRKRL